MKFYKQFVGQVVNTEQTITHLNQVLKEHNGDLERELIKAMKQHKVDQSTYHGEMMVGNHCMLMRVNGDKISESMTVAISPKIKNATNQKTLLTSMFE